MDTFVQRLPYEGLATRRLELAPDRLVICYKNMARSFDDDYEYSRIDPAVITSRRGETGWSNTVFGLVIASIVLFILTKMSSSLVFGTVVTLLQLCTALAAVWLIGLIFIKKEHLYIMDRTGDCIVSLRSTPASRAFAAELKKKAEAALNRKG